MGEFDGHVAYITGGASGIGAAAARRFIEEGAKVAVADLDSDAGQALAEDLGDGAVFIGHDVSDEAAWRAGLNTVQDRFGSLTVLVQSAGVSEPADVEHETLEHWHKILRINQDSVFLGCKHGIAAIKAAGRPGAIVNVSSSVAIRPAPWLVAYCASKAAVIAITKSSALYCAEQGYPIRVNTVHPGAIRTPMMERYLQAAENYDAALEQFASVHPMGRPGQAREVADAILYLASDKSSYVTGMSLPVDGGYCAA